MNNPQTICDPQRIQGCLGDSLSDDELAAFEIHLESCTACRQALERGAAEPCDWKSARDFLSSDTSLPLKPEADERASAMTSLHRQHDRAPDGEELEPARESVDGVLSALAPTDDPHMLGRLGPYEIAGVVGRGGMGVVLKALDPALNRYVAIKVLAPQLATSG